MKIVDSTLAPKAIGPYSQAIISNGFVFCSGQIPLNADGIICEGDIKEQAKQVMQNLKAVLESAGTGFHNVVKTTIYLVNMSDFSVVNEVYGSYFTADIKPARATVEVSGLPKNVMIEIDCIAAV